MFRSTLFLNSVNIYITNFLLFHLVNCLFLFFFLIIFLLLFQWRVVSLPVHVTLTLSVSMNLGETVTYYNL